MVVHTSYWFDMTYLLTFIKVAPPVLGWWYDSLSAGELIVTNMDKIVWY